MHTPRLPAVDWTDAPTDLNAVGSQYPSHYLGTRCIQHHYRWCAHLGCQQSTELTPPGRFEWTRLFRRNTKSCFCGLPSRFKRNLASSCRFKNLCRGFGGGGCKHRQFPWAQLFYFLAKQNGARIINFLKIICRTEHRLSCMEDKNLRGVLNHIEC